MRRTILILLILVLLPSALAEGYTVAETPVFRETLTGETAPLRFYDDLPSVPCLGLNEFYRLMTGTALAVARRGDIYTFTAPDGATAAVDVGAGTLTCDDFLRFTNLMGQVVPGMDNQYLDAPAFVMPDGLEYADPEPVVLDFAKYHIPLHGGDGDVCLPVATLSDVFTNLAYNYVSYNGETLYINSDNRLDPAWLRDPGYVDPIYSRAERPADLAAYAYDELCFAVDTFYGYPGRAELNDDLLALGLDGALQAHSDYSRRCRELLRSQKLGEYALGSQLLSTLLEDGGHTGLDFTDLWSEKPAFADFTADYYLASQADPPDRSAYARSRVNSVAQKLLRQKRRDAYGNDHYAEKGDTAVIWFDSFMYDFDGWQAYYAGEGPRPEGDQMAHVIDGLDRARANPAIHNVVLDVSCNTGGSADMVVAILSLIADVSTFDAENLPIRRVVTQRYRVDRNFDGTFDDSDNDVEYDFNFGVLTSHLSFSCGNLLPSLMHDLGMAVLGERSGGGTCAVELHATPDGFVYQFSSGLGRLVNAQGQPVDDGVPVDAVLTDGEDYSLFYDLDALSQAMNDFVATQSSTE